MSEAAGTLSIFLAAPPGLEAALQAEAAGLGFDKPAAVPGGVTIEGDWSAVWRANLLLRGATRVLVRIGAFRAVHLAQLDKRARALPWADFLHPGQTVQVSASCKRSRLYHSGAVAQRIEAAAMASASAVPAAGAPAEIKVRIERDLCEISLDSSGEPLHKRGFKQAVGKAPLRETMAALLLQECGQDGAAPVLDPMCGSGTFVIEAAERALGLAPGRARAFAFERFASFDPAAFAALKNAVAPPDPAAPPRRFLGFDRDAGAVEGARANAERAGLSAVTAFERQAISDLARPDGPPGLVMVNPPYGGRIGETEGLRALYGALGAVLKERFGGWRVGLVTSEASLARAAGLPFAPPGPPIPHGALKIRLYRTKPL